MHLFISPVSEARYIKSLVLIYDGISEIGAHLQNGIGNLICLPHLFGSSVDPNMKLCPKKAFFLYVCATCFVLPSNIRTMLEREDVKE